MKRRVLVISAVVLSAAVILTLLYVFRPLTMNEVWDKPHFSGTVLEVRDGSLLVEADEGESVRQSSDVFSVSTDVQLKDSTTDFAVGDRICVYFDGQIAESYPAQIHKVYAFTK